jgi:hypothetical protein
MVRVVGKLVASFAAVATLVTVGLTPAFAADQVPFNAQFSGSFTPVDASHLQLAGTGNALRLGSGTSSGALTNTGPVACGGFGIHDVETLTSPGNGDQVTLSIDGQACPTATPGVYEVAAPYVVTGGAGRFAGASGQGTIDCVGNFNNDTFSFAATGTISHPGGN